MKRPSTVADFGGRLRQLRKQAALTQAQLGQAVGVSNRVVSYYERESSFPPSHILTRLAAVLKVSADELLGMKSPDEDGRTIEGKFLRNWERLSDPQKRHISRLVESIVTEQSAT